MARRSSAGPATGNVSDVQPRGERAVAPGASGPSPYWPDKYRNYGATAIMNILSINYVYQVPKLSAKLGFKPLGWVTDNWSISGITTFVPWNMVGVSGVNWGNTNTNNPAPELTGSAEGARLIVLRNPVFADSQSEYHYLDYTAFAPPSPCSWTNQSMACFGNAGAGNLIKIPVRTNNWDMTFRKDIPVFGESRHLSFQAEMYNIFNHTQINGINTTITYDVQKKVSAINDAVCKGCGTCGGFCPGGAIWMNHFTTPQIVAQIDAFLLGGEQ